MLTPDWTRTQVSRAVVPRTQLAEVGSRPCSQTPRTGLLEGAAQDDKSNSCSYQFALFHRNKVKVHLHRNKENER